MKRYPDEVRIGACADYLLDKPWKQITHKWGVTHVTVTKWIRRAGSFKLRREREEK